MTATSRDATDDPAADRTVDQFDRLSDEEAKAQLSPICTSSRWTTAMLAGRPFLTRAAMHSASDAAFDMLDWPDLEEALTGHARIGERAEGDRVEARWSREEQAAAEPDVHAETDTGDTVAQRLARGNAEYEKRFGFVFLICASGKTAEQMLNQLEARLSNDDEHSEHEVVRSELAEIVSLRLNKTFAADETAPDAAQPVEQPA